MKYLLITIIAILLSGCGDTIKQNNEEKCVVEKNYFCFFNQTYEVVKCGDDINSSLVYKDDGDIKECTSNVIYSEIE